jgi:hypothetical protein
MSSASRRAEVYEYPEASDAKAGLLSTLRVKFGSCSFVERLLESSPCPGCILYGFTLCNRVSLSYVYFSHLCSPFADEPVDSACSGCAYFDLIEISRCLLRVCATRFPYLLRSKGFGVWPVLAKGREVPSREVAVVNTTAVSGEPATVAVSKITKASKELRESGNQ